MPRHSQIADRLEDLRRRTMYRQRRVVDSAQGREIRVDGRTLINFCSNDYLGLAGDPRVRKALSDGTERWGVGAGASHLVCGHMAVHHELEDALAQFVGRPRALLFGSGYAANMGAIGALAGPGDAVFQDRLNHASLLDGGWLSRADFIWFRHADVADLRAQIAARKHKGRLLIVSDGTFSMDGDLCPLAELVTVAKESGAWLMIDDAHGMGAMGPGGIGNVDGQRFGPDDVQVLVGTLGKAFGTCGAFVAGTEDLIEYLIQRARQYIFTTAIPPAVAAATLKSLEIVRTEGWRREHLHELISRFRAGATSLGLTLAASTSAIQPVIVGDAARTVTLSRELEQRGFLITAIRPPTVPVGTSRLRITLTAAHTTGDVDALLAALADVIKPQRGVR